MQSNNMNIFNQQSQNPPLFSNIPHPFSNQFMNSTEDLSSVMYNDDEHVEIQNVVQSGNKFNLDFLLFNAATEKKKVQKGKSAMIPVMFSVFAEEQATEKVKDSMANRPPIDLILVIDKSGSMSGTKIELVKSTLEYLIGLMGENDRLSLILFESGAQRLTPLQKMSVNNKESLNKVVNTITAGGGTNIANAMSYALKTIKDRKIKNPLTSVFLLSDGLDGGAQNRFKSILEKEKIEDNFSIQSFGFGSDHDPELMTSIAETKGGNFYFVEDLDSLDECFVNAFGGLISVAAQNVSFNVSLNKEKLDLKVIKTYGNWKTFPADNFYQYQINYLMAGVSKEYMMVIEVPAVNETGNFKILNCVFEAESTDSQNKCQSSKEVFIEVVDTEEEVKQDEPDLVVKLNHMRLNGAEILSEAMTLADNRDYEKGKILIDGFIAELMASNLDKDPSMVQLLADLRQAHGNMHETQYMKSGKKMMMECKGAYMEKRSRKNVDLYSNNAQMSMQNDLRMFKAAK